MIKDIESCTDSISVKKYYTYEITVKSHAICNICGRTHKKGVRR